MKALEFTTAELCAQWLDSFGGDHETAQETAAELRRLAEVNAELLGALEMCLNVWNRGGHEWQEAFASAKSAIAKAKEQQ